MRITKDTALFFDASVLIAGAGSPKGGSALLLEACKAGGFEATTASSVLIEAERNIQRLVGSNRFPADALLRYYAMLNEIDWEVVEEPSSESSTRAARLIAEKDVHVLAAAMDSGCEFLLTLDLADFKTPELEAAELPFEILSPGEFINSYYHLHES